MTKKKTIYIVFAICLIAIAMACVILYKDAQAEKEQAKDDAKEWSEIIDDHNREFIEIQKE